MDALQKGASRFGEKRQALLYAVANVLAELAYRTLRGKLAGLRFFCAPIEGAHSSPSETLGVRPSHKAGNECEIYGWRANLFGKQLFPIPIDQNILMPNPKLSSESRASRKSGSHLNQQAVPLVGENPLASNER
jgi:hypothetical protein